MKLATILDVRDATGFDDLNQVNDAIDFALESATLSLGAKLSTEFDKDATRQDVFFVADQVWSGGRPRNTFKLSRAFASSVLVFHAATRDDVNSGIKTEVTTSAQVDSERGLVTLVDLDLTRRFVEVTYAAGFDADATEPDLFDLTQVPDWLHHAGVLEARVSLSDHPLFARGDDERTEVDFIKGQLNMIVDQHARDLPHAWDPEVRG